MPFIGILNTEKKGKALDMTIKTERSKKVLWLFENFIIVLALFAKAEVIPSDGTENAFIAFIAKFRDSFESSGINGLIFFALFYYFQREAASKKLKNDWRLILLSGLFAVMYIAGRSMRDSGTLAFMTANSYQRFFSCLCILGYWFMFDLILRWGLYCFEKAEPEQYSARPEIRVWLAYTAIIFICWLPWLFSSYPAAFCPDSIWQLKEGLGYKEFTTHHPPLSTAIMTLCVNLGAAIKSRTFGCFIYVVMQTVLGSMIFAYALVVLRRMGISRGARIAAVLFYCLNPLWGNYCQWLEKDMLYTEFYVLTAVQLIEVLHTGNCSGKKTAAIYASSVMALLLRNNGVYELLPFMILLIFCIPRELRKRMFCAVFAVVLTYGAVVYGLYPALGFKKGSEREMLSIPFQQTARYAAYAGDEVTEYEREVIDSVLDYDSLAAKYSYYVSDPVKNKYHGDSESLKKYFPVWFEMGFKHPTIYIDALIGMSYGYTAPLETDYIEPGISLPTDDVHEVGIPGITRRTSEALSVPANLIWWTAHTIPVLLLLTIAGMYTWLTLACIVMLWIKKKASAFLPLIPGAMNILICIASPLSSSIRYCLSTVAMMPMILWWTALNVSAGKNGKSQQKVE